MAVKNQLLAGHFQRGYRSPPSTNSFTSSEGKEHGRMVYPVLSAEFSNAVAPRGPTGRDYMGAKRNAIAEGLRDKGQSPVISNEDGSHER